MSYDLFLASIPVILEGFRLTVIITLSAFCLGQVAALPLALAAASRHRALAWPAQFYIFFVRGSPVLV